MRYILTLTFLCVLQFFSYSQEFVKRILLIGDAGEINNQQSSLITEAVSLVIKDSTLVFYLGDNIYPSGMGLEGKEQENGRLSLESQYAPFRKQNVPVYFLAGNHDWNVSRKGGLEKLKAEEDFLVFQQDSNLQLIPSAGNPGPINIPIAEGFNIIVYDSEYWLYPYHSPSEDLIEKRKIFNQELTTLFNKNSDNVILVLSHHPMATYGEHSLIFGWKQHLFPLTRINKDLYIPLPIVGSLYPLWRGVLFKSAEDLPSKPYQHLVNDVLKARGDHQNTLFAAGHDHGLQFIEDQSITQIVSGSGSKTSFIIDNKNLKFKYQQQGFSVIDYYDNGDILLSYYTFESDRVHKSFETIIKKKI